MAISPTTKEQRASERITEEVTSWPGVQAGPGRRGEFAFTLGRRELGHLHGDHALHLGFPKDEWRRLYDQGRIDYHPVFPGKPGYASRALRTAEDVRDAIELIRLNYERAVARHGLPEPEAASAEASDERTVETMELVLPGIYASTAETLPFAPSLEIRSFLLRRGEGNILLYSTKELETSAAAIQDLGGISRHYLNHWHEAIFASEWLDAPLFVHEAERDSVIESYDVRATFSRRHTFGEDFEVIPTPGHTAGATAYLWESGEHRFLFTGDTVYLSEGEWVAAMLPSSDRQSYLDSLELIRGLDFDVLVPWAASRGQAYHAVTNRADTQRRIDSILARLRRNDDH